MKPTVTLLDSYQFLALRTAGKHPDPDEALKCWAMGVSGEAGEFVDSVKKIFYKAAHRESPLLQRWDESMR